MWQLGKMEQKKCCLCKQVKMARIHVIYTGGTIGMIRNDAGALTPAKNELPKRLRENPNCHDPYYIGYNKNSDESHLILPPVEGAPTRVLYDVVEYSPLLDSSCMNMTDWRGIANDIADSYENYDGFVILHGTDTMAYTASALSFMFQNLGKPVVITGSQIPIFETRSDGRENFIGSLVLAGNYNIPEVMIYFGNRIMRGCRTTKISSDAFDAFDSPNQPPLGTMGVKVTINNRQIFRHCILGDFSVDTEIEENIGILRIYPGITSAVLRAFFAPPMKGVVIQSFGAGNIPSNNTELLDEIRNAVESGLLIVNITQCLNGYVSPIYETGAWMGMGVLSGCDMTQEAAFTKLSYVLGKDKWDLDSKKRIMQLSLRGEMTTSKVAETNDIDLIEGVARTLHLSKCRERDQMCSTFLPALVDAAVREGNVEKLKYLREYGANLSDTNCEGRTALHLSCYLGQLNCVLYLLDSKCPTDLTDRFNRTPLHEAIDTDNHEIINAIVKHGATLQEDKDALAEKLCVVSQYGQIERLESYRLAGVDLMLPDRNGRTPLHYACQLGKTEVVEYLLQYYNCICMKDKRGLTPMQYARAGNHKGAGILLRAYKIKQKTTPQGI